MVLFLQLLPLLTLVALLASGRATPAWSCLAAMVLALPAVWLALPQGASLAGFAARGLMEGAWLALVPVGIITGGLVFHAAVRGQSSRAAPTRTPVDALFTAAFLLGPFTEAVTGFGVGTVFAIGAVRAAGVGGVAAAAIGLLAQVLIPWGGLGPGTAIGAALAGIDPQAMAGRNAWLLAPTWLLLLPLFWWWCRLGGQVVPMAKRLRQLGWVALTGALLIGLHHVVPWELCGLLATGPVLAVRLLLAAPPQGRSGWTGAARAASPYMLLVLLLLGGRLWPDAPRLHPFPDLPALPLNHAMTALWLAALIMVAIRGLSRHAVGAALLRAHRPALALVMFVLLARVLSNAGVPVALAAALLAGFGAWAPFASPLLAGVAGFFAGTNVGSNAAMMPLQAALGRASGLGPLVLPAVQNGTLALIASPQLTAVASGLAGTGVTPSGIWRIMWPVFIIAIVVGITSILIG